MSIDYHLLVNDAMLGIMRRILEQVRDYGLEDERGLYISFDTNHPDLVISKSLKARYPSEMTIILQYQYQNLIVTNDYFLVTLSFNEISETIKVPFKSLLSFSDPLMEFSLEFNDFVGPASENFSQHPDHQSENIKNSPPSNIDTAKQESRAEIISLAEFRAKKE